MFLFMYIKYSDQHVIVSKITGLYLCRFKKTLLLILLHALSDSATYFAYTITLQSLP